MKLLLSIAKWLERHDLLASFFGCYFIIAILVHFYSDVVQEWGIITVVIMISLILAAFNGVIIPAIIWACRAIASQGETDHGEEN